MKIKQSLAGVGLGIAALLLSACGGNSNPLGEAARPSPHSRVRQVQVQRVPGRRRFGGLHGVQDPGRDLFPSHEGEGRRLIDQARHRIARDLHQGLAGWVDLGRT